MTRLAIFLMCCVVWTTAQQPMAGSIEGVVRDQAGSPIDRVAMQATNLDSGSMRLGVTDAHGVYQFVDLPTGRYSILAQRSGYQDYKLSLVTVAPSEHVRMADITMVSANTHSMRH